MSAIQQFKQRLQKEGFHVNQQVRNDSKDAKVDKTKLMNQSKSRSSSQNMASMNKHVSHTLLQNQAHYQNLSRKAYQPTSQKGQEKQLNKKDDKSATGEHLKKKIKLSNLMLNPVDNLTKEITANIQEREKIKEALIAEKQENIYQSHPAMQIKETLDKMKNKIASAQRKMNQSFSHKVSVSNFEAEKVHTKKEQHNSDHLINTEDHSDIKNTQKSLFVQGESTALMTGKNSSTARDSLTTPATYEASQFTLNVLGDSNEKTPTQFKSNTSKSTIQDTDEQGNRLSILPSAKRPKVPSSKKKDCNSKKKREAKKKEDALEEFKNPLDRIREEVKGMQASSKNISKDGNSSRQNFVKLNMKNYKPRLRGAAFSNKILAKKRNMMKFRDRMKRQLQIENAKNRDQVNIYGGLGKVGLDHKSNIGQDGEETLVPGFSASALKYVKIAKPKEDDEEEEEEECEEVEEFLAGDLENVKNELQQIDEEVKDECSQDELEGALEDDEVVDFDKPLYPELPKTDEEYVRILKERFGHPSFKEGQLEALKILLEDKKNALVVLATGGGKSLVYQYASMFLPGLVLLVTPLISLMTDQLGKLPDFIPGAAINSQQSYIMKKQIMQATVEKKIKVLFISPERFFIEDFSRFNRVISLVCVDEIHCASEWSHNFRPAYLKINDMIKEKLSDKCVVLGLTATATKATQRSICELFNVKFPGHIVTQHDLSRMNLQLSITRDQEKQRSLLSLLKSESFRKLESILIFATHKKTCDLLASFLTIRVLVCTIAFSMGIDKSDIESVIHYDMPKSIENYVQEIGRAGRNGKLARCHLFLNNEDFFLIRRLIFTDLLDNYNALKLTNKIVVEGKKSLLHLINPEIMTSKKRKMKHPKKISNKNEEEENYSRIIEEFEHEALIQKHYQKDRNGIQKLIFEDIEDINPNHMYVFLDVKETSSILDLKREVIMTMLNSLEKLPEGKRFFKFQGVLAGSIGLRFHKSNIQGIAEQSPFIATYLTLAKEFQGVYRCSTQRLSYALNMSPFEIPKHLYNLQSAGGGQITYEMDQECFVLKLKHIPFGGQTLDLAQEMLVETRKIEKNMVQKLNCMYFVARRVSMPSIEHMLKREKNEDAPAMYKGFSKQLNELINLYFSITNEDDMEIQIAGDEEERKIMMPLQYIDSHREKANVESEIKMMLKEFHDQGQSTFDPNERMKPLDIVKILMGIYSDRGNIKRFMNNSKIWAKFQEYDYEDIYKVASSTVNQFYLDQVNGGNIRESKESNKDVEMIPSGNPSKKRRLND